MILSGNGCEREKKLSWGLEKEDQMQMLKEGRKDCKSCAGQEEEGLKRGTRLRVHEPGTSVHKENGSNP